MLPVGELDDFTSSSVDIDNDRGCDRSVEVEQMDLETLVLCGDVKVNFSGTFWKETDDEKRVILKKVEKDILKV